MARTPKTPVESNPLEAARMATASINAKLAEIVKMASTPEGLAKLQVSLEPQEEGGEEGLSKKQMWVLKAMQQHPEIESQIFDFAKFTHGKHPNSSRILIRGIND